MIEIGSIYLAIVQFQPMSYEKQNIHLVELPFGIDEFSLFAIDMVINIFSSYKVHEKQNLELAATSKLIININKYMYFFVELRLFQYGTLLICWKFVYGSRFEDLYICN